MIYRRSQAALLAFSLSFNAVLYIEQDKNRIPLLLCCMPGTVAAALKSGFGGPKSSPAFQRYCDPSVADSGANVGAADVPKAN